jgi:glycosyltransferase involved in cell wall biosynthesis
MLHGKKVVVVLPAYRAEKTLERTYREIPHEHVDLVLLVDDASNDATVARAEELGVETFVHEANTGYGGNQKTCYREALKAGADIVVMLHPDYQYDPRLVTAMAAMTASVVYDVVLGSRIRGDRRSALQGKSG